jgi:hypothetical protein
MAVPSLVVRAAALSVVRENYMLNSEELTRPKIRVRVLYDDYSDENLRCRV